MTREQKELLYNIASWHSKDFYNRMVDTWTDRHYQMDTDCRLNIRILENTYQEKYGALPKWEYINDVWDAMQQLKMELEDN